MKVEARIDQLNTRLWEIRITVNTVTVKLEAIEGDHTQAKESAMLLLTALQRNAGTANIVTKGVQ